MRDERLVERLHRRLGEACRGKTVALISHWGGDADSIGSSYVLSRLVKSIYGAVDTVFKIPDEPTTYAKAVMSKLGFTEGVLSNPDLYIAIDVGSEEQLGDLRDVIIYSGVPVILIDHHIHEITDNTRTEYYTSDIYQATSEIIYDLAQYAGWSLDRLDATALFLGIYYDTARLSVADGETAVKICSLLESGIVPAEVLSGLETVMDDSERMARLRAALRMKAYKVGEWVVACSEVSAFQSAASRSLIWLGAHLALVGGQEGDLANISIRATGDFVKSTNISVGDSLVQLILSRFEGSGGGHRSIGRVRCRGRLQDIYNHIIRHLSLMLGVGWEEIAE